MSGAEGYTDEGADYHDPDAGAKAVDQEYQDEALPPPGEYQPVCTAVVFKASRKGAPQLVLTLNDPEKGAEAKIWVTRVRGGWFPEGVFAAFGNETPVADADGRLRFKSSESEWVGKLVTATGYHEPYNGVPQFRFGNLRPAAAGVGAKAFGY